MVVLSQKFTEFYRYRKTLSFIPVVDPPEGIISMYTLKKVVYFMINGGFCHLLSPFVTFCHLLSPFVTFCHLLSCQFFLRKVNTLNL